MANCAYDNLYLVMMMRLIIDSDDRCDLGVVHSGLHIYILISTHLPVLPHSTTRYILRLFLFTFVFVPIYSYHHLHSWLGLFYTYSWTTRCWTIFTLHWFPVVVGVTIPGADFTTVVTSGVVFPQLIVPVGVVPKFYVPRLDTHFPDSHYSDTGFVVVILPFYCSIWFFICSHCCHYTLLHVHIPVVVVVGFPTCSHNFTDLITTFTFFDLFDYILLFTFTWDYSCSYRYFCTATALFIVVSIFTFSTTYTKFLLFTHILLFVQFLFDLLHCSVLLFWWSHSYSICCWNCCLHFYLFYRTHFIWWLLSYSSCVVFGWFYLHTLHLHVYRLFFCSYFDSPILLFLHSVHSRSLNSFGSFYFTTFTCCPLRLVFVLFTFTHTFSGIHSVPIPALILRYTPRSTVYSTFVYWTLHTVAVVHFRLRFYHYHHLTTARFLHHRSCHRRVSFPWLLPPFWTTQFRTPRHCLLRFALPRSLYDIAISLYIRSCCARICLFVQLIRGSLHYGSTIHSLRYTVGFLLHRSCTHLRTFPFCLRYHHHFRHVYHCARPPMVLVRSPRLHTTLHHHCHCQFLYNLQFYVPYTRLILFLIRSDLVTSYIWICWPSS